MIENPSAAVEHRRTVILGAGAAAALLAVLGISRAVAQTAGATTPLPPPQVTWQEAMRALVGDAPPVEGKIALELPDLAENGNVVPVAVAVESPMTEADHVRAVHILSTGNPKPDVASFYFTLQSGKAAASSRMRLGKTQDVVAVAEMSDGKVFLTKRQVKVTIGGCGGG